MATSRDPARTAGGHEVRDVDVRSLAILAAGLGLAVVVTLILMLGAFNYFAAREDRSQPPPSTLAARPSSQLPPEPRLQQDPVRELHAMRAQEEAHLSGFGWVHRDAGIARVPVERAMELLVQRGLPVRRAPASAGAGQEPPR